MSGRTLLEGDLGAEALRRLAEAEDLKPATLRGLVEVVRSQMGRARRRGLYDDFDRLLAQDD